MGRVRGLQAQKGDLSGSWAEGAGGVTSHVAGVGGGGGGTFPQRRVERCCRPLQLRDTEPPRCAGHPVCLGPRQHSRSSPGPTVGWRWSETWDACL